MAETSRGGAGKKARAVGASATKRLPSRCFVISPFGGWFDKYYSEIYDPAIRAVGLEPCRADDLFRPSSIVHDIWDYVQTSDVLLADLSEKNPNVFYELGLAHASDKPVVLVAQTMEDVPFDLRALRVIIYETAAPNWASELGERIGQALKEVLREPDTAVLAPFNKSARKPSLHEADISEEDRIFRLEREMNLLRAQMLTSARAVEREPIMGPSAARALIRQYTEDGVPPELVRARLQSRGVPLEFVDRYLRDLERGVASSGVEDNGPPAGV